METIRAFSMNLSHPKENANFLFKNAATSHKVEVTPFFQGPCDWAVVRALITSANFGISENLLTLSCK